MKDPTLWHAFGWAVFACGMFLALTGGLGPPFYFGLALIFGSGLFHARASTLRRRSRIEDIRAFGASNGLISIELTEEDLSALPLRYLQKNGGKATASLLGKWGESTILVLDHEYATGWGRSRRAHPRSAVVLEVDAHLPSLAIERESAFSRFGDKVGFRDAVTGDQPFDRAFRLHPRGASTGELLSVELRRWLQSESQQWQWNIAERYVMCFPVAEGLTDIDDLPEQINTCIRFAEQLPLRQFPAGGLRSLDRPRWKSPPDATRGQQAEPGVSALWRR